jgi:putative acetyltransferase
MASARYDKSMKLIEEHPEQEEVIRRVIVDAFGRNAEARLLDDLRSSSDLAISIVAVEAGEVCGHIALSRLKSPVGACALAPLSVLKARQHQGIGSALVRRAVERARESRYEIIFVVGKPHYYTRFGFKAEEAALFPCRYAGPHFMALNLTGRRIEPTPVVYARAFDKLE